jgi:hypothetical protein
VQGQSAESLRARLNALREQAKDLLDRLVYAQGGKKVQSVAQNSAETYFKVTFFCLESSQGKI